ncbi:MAG: HEAT repeat domain-containing protein, partial [Patescibacteria group bacterium]|nr:HEAT repeat domain-containing protein [Patescibacteria group bacterium]
PTVLSLCGVPVPGHMQGSAFLGPKASAPRRYVYGARDRVDEVFDLSRSVRDGRWLYIRNFMPHLSWMPPERYSDGSAFRREFKRLAAAGQLNANQLTYAAPRRAIEELYDTHADPHQLHNLADRPEHREQQQRLRGELIRWMTDSRDAGFLTEPQVWHRIGHNSTPLELAGNAMLCPLDDLLRAAGLVGRENTWDEQVTLLKHGDDGIRYWAAVGLHAAATGGQLSSRAVRSAMQEQLADPSPVVRIELASALMALGPNEAAIAVLTKDLGHDRPDVVLHAARAAELLGERARPLLPVMRKTLEQARAAEQRGDLPMFIRFSLEAALERFPYSECP